jgi:ribose transport system substrate-binding protein
MRRTLVRLVRLVLLAIPVLMLGTAACRPAAQAGSRAGGKRLLVGVIPKGTAQEYWKGVHAGAIRAAKELDVDILWEGPLREDDREEQIKVVDNVVSRGVAGVLLAPLDNRALVTPVRNATRSGIPVVIFDSQLDTDEYISLIETDNYKGGRMAGDHLAALLGKKGPVMMLRLQVGSASTTQREQGFLDAIAGCKEMSVVSSNQYGSTVSDVAYRAAENLIAAQRVAQGAVAGIFTPNETTTFAMLRALQNANLAGKVRFVGFDSSDKVLQGLRDGLIDGLVLQNPVAMGYQGVKTVVQHLKGEKVPKNIDTGVTLVTKDNMDTPELQERLHPGRAPELK